MRTNSSLILVYSRYIQILSSLYPRRSDLGCLVDMGLHYLLLTLTQLMSWYLHDHEISSQHCCRLTVRRPDLINLPGN